MVVASKSTKITSKQTKYSTTVLSTSTTTTIPTNTISISTTVIPATTETNDDEDDEDEDFSGKQFRHKSQKHRVSKISSETSMTTATPNITTRTLGPEVIISTQIPENNLNIESQTEAFQREDSDDEDEEDEESLRQNYHRHNRRSRNRNENHNNTNNIQEIDKNKQILNESSQQTQQILIQLYPPENEMYDDQNFSTCEGPHTIRTKEGLCQCEENFSFGDPFGEYGCWKCDHRCNSNATCTQSGECKCNMGFIGDGFRQCELAIPHLIGISPSKGKHFGGDQIIAYFNISRHKDNSRLHLVSTVFCRFDSEVIEGQISSPGEALCITPKGKGDTSARFSISFSGSHWSHSLPYYYVNEDTIIRKEITSGIIIFAIISSLALAKRKYSSKHSIEQRPFLYVQE